MEVVTVRLPHNLTSLEQAHKVLANVLNKVGCGNCFSGRDIRFTHEIDYRVDPATLAVRETIG